MRNTKLDQVIGQIARQKNTTPSHVRAEMEAALKIAQSSKNPSTQAKWASIPHQGDTVSLEEFMEFMTVLLNQLEQS